MRIAMMTNTYLPHVGGVAQSVARSTAALRARGHRVLVVAPDFPGAPGKEPEVVRVPAIQEFNGSDFSVALPAPRILHEALEDFQPEVIHAHHPFLLGDTALRASAARGIPLVFTHHTMYEQYTHYVPLGARELGNFVVNLATGYANQCDRVIAPSESVREILRARGVKTAVQVAPSGVDVEQFARGDRKGARARLGLPAHGFVIGHTGRLAEEKNLGFLAEALTLALQGIENTWALIVGGGPAEDRMRARFEEGGVGERAVLAGRLEGQALVDAYHAMDVFAFASLSETQGMVLAEAMAAGLPVAALDAPGVREVIRDRENGRLLVEQDAGAFAGALSGLARSSLDDFEVMRRHALDTARAFSTEACTDRLEAVYEDALGACRDKAAFVEGEWGTLMNAVREEYALWKHRAAALGEAIKRELEG